MRGRECQSCKYKFLTIEIHEDALKELVDLRDIKSEINDKISYLPNVEYMTKIKDLLQYLEKLD